MYTDDARHYRRQPGARQRAQQRAPGHLLMHAPLPSPPPLKTTCPYCGVGCGLKVTPDGLGGAAVEGDPEHPANYGRTCSKGSALGETLSLDTRLLHPMLRQADGALARTSWDTALERVADGFKAIVEKHDPNAIAFYLSGQLLTEDYYVANKLMKGFIGSSNVDTNSRLCMASSVAGHRRAFGADTVPGTYADLDRADLIILVGSNAAWCHPVLLQRMLRNKAERGARIVAIDPRRTATAGDADLFLPIAPGMDTALFAGLLAYLADDDALDTSYIKAHTTGFAEALARAKEIAPDIAATAAATELAEDDVARFFDLFRATCRTVTCYSQGVNQSAQGTDKVNAIINCHLATGRIGKPGAGPFSLTGQPNAMGGREVGGLANMLAAHMGFSPTEIDRVRRFWNAPRMAEHEGLKAVAMFDAIARGEIKALWVMATNPAVSLPRAAAVREALRKLELFVVSENVVSNDTVNVGAHVLLPAAAWGEKDGTVTNSERRISRQRAFLSLPGEVKPDWQIVTEVARAMGFAEAFAWRSAADVFREHAALSDFENFGMRDFDIGGLAALSDAAYDTLAPVQWPLCKGDGPGERRFFARGGFYTPDGKARFIAVEPPALKDASSSEFPLRLNTGRVRDQWHTMTRTGLSPRLALHLPEPFVEVHPDDAARFGLADGGFARIASAHGACIVKVAVSDGQRSGSLFLPIHWSGETASAARAGDLVAPHTDPLSGQPEAKATPAAIVPVAFALRGFIRTPRAVPLPAATWWTRIAAADGFEYRLASDQGPMLWHDFAYGMIPADAHLAEQLDGQIYRAAAVVDGAVDNLIGLAPAGLPVCWDALGPLALDDEGTPLAQVSSGAAFETDAVVCACFGVGEQTIHDAVACGRARNVAQIGDVTRAGTNCGSCLPELRRIVARHMAKE
jgi:assimilatory nitrate reductase catalytic subunit